MPGIAEPALKAVESRACAVEATKSEAMHNCNLLTEQFLLACPHKAGVFGDAASPSVF